MCVPWGGCVCLASGPVSWLWLAACLSGVPLGPTLVHCASSGPVALSASVRFPVAVVPSPTRGARPCIHWAVERGKCRPAEDLAHGACRWPLPRQGRWARSTSYPLGGPQWGCRWRVPPALVSRYVSCGGFARVDPVTYASGFLYCPSLDGRLGQHLTLRVARRHARVRVCVCLWLCFRPSGRCCGARTHPSGRRLFRSRQGLGSLPGADSSIRTAPVP